MRLLLIAVLTSSFSLMHAQSIKIMEIFNSSEVNAEFSADNTQIITVDQEAFKATYDLKTMQRLHLRDSLQLPRPVIDTIKSIDPINGQVVIKRFGVSPLVGNYHLSQNRKFLSTINMDGIHIYNVFTNVTGQGLLYSNLGRGDYPDVTKYLNHFSDDYVMLFNDGSGVIFNASTSRQSEFKIHLGVRPSLVCLSKDQTLLAVASREMDTIDVYSLLNDKLLIRYCDRSPYESAAVMHFSPNGNKLLVSRGNEEPKILGVQIGDNIVKLNGHANKVTDACYSPDGKWIATVSYDGTVRRWDAEHGTLIESIEEKTSGRLYDVKISNDGQYYLVNAASTLPNVPKIYVYRVSKVKEPDNLANVPADKSRLTDIASERGGQVVATKKSDPTSTARNLALVIGISNYSDSLGWKPLANPIFDAWTLRTELSKDYEYDVIYLADPNKVAIYNALDSIRGLFEAFHDSVNSNLLIFIAGHGGFDDFVSGYIVPNDAQKPSLDKYKYSYITHSQLRDIIGNIPAKHTLVLLDACYGGTFDQLISQARSRSGDRDGMYNNVSYKDLIRRKSNKTTRLYVTSGGKEYVPDGRPGRHSPFAARLIDLLERCADARVPITYGRICNALEMLNPEPRSGTFGDNEFGSDFILIPISLTNQ